MESNSRAKNRKTVYRNKISICFIFRLFFIINIHLIFISKFGNIVFLGDATQNMKFQPSESSYSIEMLIKA